MIVDFCFIRLNFVGLQNAEMKFNFGATAFKYPPQGGYIAIDKAPDSFSTVSPVLGSAPAPSKKKAPNAPYAIVIEVCSL